MEDETSDRLRSRDALQREREQIRYYRRGMTPEQRGRFRRRVEQTKREMGLAGADVLPEESLQMIREEVLGMADE